MLQSLRAAASCSLVKFKAEGFVVKVADPELLRKVISSDLLTEKAAN